MQFSRTGWIVPAGLAAGAVALSVLVSIWPVLPGDKAILEAVRNTHLPLLDWLCGSLDSLGDSWVVAASVLSLSSILWIRGRRGEALACLLIIPLELMALGLREVIDRPRPLPSAWIPVPPTPGFPSGTTLHAVLLFGYMAYLCRVCLGPGKLRIGLQTLLILAIVVVSYSRIYVGVHWPLDVLGAWLFGGFYLWFIVAIGLPAIEKLRGKSLDSNGGGKADISHL